MILVCFRWIKFHRNFSSSISWEYFHTIRSWGSYLFFFIYMYQIIFTLFLLTFGSIPFGSNVEFLMIKWKPCLHIQSYCARRIWKTVLEEEVLRIWGSLGFGSMKEFFLPCLEDLSLLTLGTIWRLVSELSVFFNEFLLLLNVYEL